MSDANKTRGTRNINSSSSEFNSLHFLVESLIMQTVNTAEVVRVTKVYPGGPGGAAGYVDVLPLVCQLDGWNNTIPPVQVFRLPYSRLQGGKAALVIDPEPGDIGLAIVAKRDSTTVEQGQAEPVQPGSFRNFSLADGFYLGGFLNKAPSIWLELNQDNEAVLHAPMRVTVETQECIIDAPNSRFTGNVFVQGNVTWAGIGQGDGGPAVFRGGLTNTEGVITSNNVTLETHTHSGVETGSGNTGGPNGG